MQQNFKDYLTKLLLTDDRLKDQQGELKGNLVKEFINTLDEKLITLLLEDEQTSEKFFMKIKDVYVFKTNEFKFFLDENSIDNSFTQYSNQIGLSSGGKFLKDNTDVVLNFPFKDCVLEGGQSTEDGLDTYFEYDEKQEDYTEKQSKRKEIFFNEVLAKDEIDRLLEPKAFTNITKYDSKGESKPTKFNRNAKGTITDNLIIKGNNLLALHSLKQEFKGKVKLIYIDPPYNTGNDSFAYNDNFNHSTWLSFMRNRLMVARDLLSEDGSIFIQIDDFEDAYLKILLDEVFGANQFRNKITWKRRGGSANPKNRLNNVVDYILWYSKNENFTFNSPFSLNDPNTKKYINERFNNIDENGRKFMKSPLQSPNPRPNLMYNYKGFKTPKNGWSISEIKMKEWDDKGKLWFPNDKNKNINRKIYLDEYSGQPVSSLWTDISVINPMSNERGSFEGGQKPEALLERIINMTTNEKDIVLDYHLGSGTTGAVAHKMNRQYIGLEQLDYGDNDSIKRLQNVINNDQSGISKTVNWKGGGCFTYLELAKNNQTAKEKILKCKNYDELMQYFDTMYTHYFLHYNVRIKEFKEVISQEKNFKNLTLNRQKEIFIKMLDLNQLYVNLSEMEDSRYKLDAKDIALSKDFYQIK